MKSTSLVISCNSVVVLKDNKKCIADYPSMYQELQKKSLFSYVKRSAEEIQDSLLIALYECSYYLFY